MSDMSKHMRISRVLTSVFTALLIVFVAPAISLAAPYGSDSYGECAYNEGCAATSTDGETDGDTNSHGHLSDTGENQKFFVYGALILIGVGAIIYTIKRKRSYKLKT